MRAYPPPNFVFLAFLGAEIAEGQNMPPSRRGILKPSPGDVLTLISAASSAATLAAAALDEAQQGDGGGDGQRQFGTRDVPQTWLHSFSPCAVCRQAGVFLHLFQLTVDPRHRARATFTTLSVRPSGVPGSSTSQVCQTNSPG